jgi:hypothetical protein
MLGCMSLTEWEDKSSGSFKVIVIVAFWFSRALFKYRLPASFDAEAQFPKPGVAGSNPGSPSCFFTPARVSQKA